MTQDFENKVPAFSQFPESVKTAGVEEEAWAPQCPQGPRSCHLCQDPREPRDLHLVIPGVWSHPQVPRDGALPDQSSASLPAA